MTSDSGSFCLKRKGNFNCDTSCKEFKMGTSNGNEPDLILPFSLHLFRNVENAAEIRKLAFTTQLPCCMLKPKYVLDIFQLGVVIKKALDNQRNGKMKTKTVATEIIYYLSPSKSITDSLKNFGAGDQDTDILFLYDGNDFGDKIGNVVKGEEVSTEQLTQFTDIPAITEIYGISDIELSTSSLIDSVVSRIASKEFIL